MHQHLRLSEAGDEHRRQEVVELKGQVHLTNVKGCVCGGWGAGGACRVRMGEVAA